MIFDPTRVEPGRRVVGRPQFDAIVLFRPEEEAAHREQHRCHREEDGPPRVNTDPATQPVLDTAQCIRLSWTLDTSVVTRTFKST